MSKSPDTNIFIPAIGGAALILGVGYGVANMGYGKSTIQALEAGIEQAKAQASAAAEDAEAQTARISELEAQLAEVQASAEDQIAAAKQAADDAAASAESQLASLRARLRDAQSQPMADGADEKLGDAVVQASVAAPAPEGMTYGLGRPALDEELAAWDVDVRPDGHGLPVGSGNAIDGEEAYINNCASCHGDFAEGLGNWPKLSGGFDTLADEDPVKTVGSYWPYVSTVWDYVHRSMPFGNAGTLTEDEVYGIVAYILYSNYLIEDDFELSNETFAEVEMPNAGGFVIDDRPQVEYAEWSGEPCMENCKDGPVEITRRSSDVGVTPADDGSMAESLMELQLAELGGTEWGKNELAGSVLMDPNAEPAAAEAEAAEPEPEQMAATESMDDSEPEAPAEEITVEADPELVAAGEKQFKKCQACHQVGDGAKNRTGPQLNGVFGRTVGSVEGFKYSGALQSAHDEGMVWNEETLSAFLEKPKTYMKGTKMAFGGFKSQDDIDAVLAYLRTFSQ